MASAAGTAKSVSPVVNLARALVVSYYKFHFRVGRNGMNSWQGVARQLGRETYTIPEYQHESPAFFSQISMCASFDSAEHLQVKELLQTIDPHHPLLGNTCRTLLSQVNVNFMNEGELGSLRKRLTKFGINFEAPALKRKLLGIQEVYSVDWVHIPRALTCSLLSIGCAVFPCILPACAAFLSSTRCKLI